MSRQLAASVLLVLSALLSACGDGPPAQTPSLSMPQPQATPLVTPDPALSLDARSAYVAAICPAFLDILALDPRLATLRAEGSAESDVTMLVTELEAVAEELRTVLNSLEATPHWRPGQLLRVELIEALHAIRVAVLDVADDSAAHDAAERLASVPYISSPSMDGAMGQATNAGFNCEGVE